MELHSARQESGFEAHHRSKIISFRVSDDEYGAVEVASRRHGFRSVPLFARWIVLNEKIDDPNQTVVDCDINRLWRRLEAMIAVLEDLTEQVSAVQGSTQA